VKTVWDDSNRRELQDRLRRLTSQHPRQWGRMTAPHMVTHLIESMRMANGDVRLPSRKVPLRFTPLKQLIIYCLPFPKGVPTAPALSLASRLSGAATSPCSTY
jgi:hypothetical protein